MAFLYPEKGSGAGRPPGSGITGDITIVNGVATIGAGEVTNAMIAPNSVDGTVVKNLAAANVIGGIPVLFKISIADAASNNTNVTMTHQVTVVDAWIIPRATGDAGNTFVVGNGASAISSAMVGNVDTTVARTTTIDDATQTIAAAGSLRVTWVRNAGSSLCDVYVLGYRSA
jgi:hypothetical protein